jgi:hypothetical protein
MHENGTFRKRMSLVVEPGKLSADLVGACRVFPARPLSRTCLNLTDWAAVEDAAGASLMSHGEGPASEPTPAGQPAAMASSPDRPDRYRDSA